MVDPPVQLRKQADFFSVLLEQFRWGHTACKPPLRTGGCYLCGHGFTRSVVVSTVFLPPPYDSLPAEWGLAASDHRALTFVVVIVVIKENPVPRFLDLMGQGAVREQCGI